MVAPRERQPGVHHQLVGGEPAGLSASEDRFDDIRREEVQSQQSRHVTGGDLLGRPNLFEGHVSGGLDSALDPAGADKKPDEGIIGRRRIRFASDDEPQLLARPLEFGRDRQQEGMIVIAVMGSSERRACIAGP